MTHQNMEKNLQTLPSLGIFWGKMTYFVAGISEKKWLQCMTMHPILHYQPKDQTFIFYFLVAVRTEDSISTIS